MFPLCTVRDKELVSCVRLHTARIDVNVSCSCCSEDWTPLGTKQHVTRPEDNAMPPPKQRVTKMSRLSLSSTASAGFEPTRSDRVPRELSNRLKR